MREEGRGQDLDGPHQAAGHGQFGPAQHRQVTAAGVAGVVRQRRVGIELAIAGVKGPVESGSGGAQVGVKPGGAPLGGARAGPGGAGAGLGGARAGPRERRPGRKPATGANPRLRGTGARA